MKHLLLFAFLILQSLSCLSSAQGYSDYVDVFIGTAGDNGQVDPAACVPYGMVRIAPDMEPRSHSGYDYEVDRISGFSINRLSGIGCGGAGGNLSLRPDERATELFIEKSTEHARPGYYSVHLSNGVACEFTSTGKVGIYRFTYPEGMPKVVTLDLKSSFARLIDAGITQPSGVDTHLKGFVQATNTCDHGAYKLYFDLYCPNEYTFRLDDDRYVHLLVSGNARTVELRMALSPLDTETAVAENRRKTDFSFDQLRVAAANEWETQLSRIRIEASDEEKTLFYTNLYRVLLSPHDVTSPDGRYLGTDGQEHIARDFTYHGSWSIWDTYHTKFPLISLIDPPRTRDIAHSLIQLCTEGKRDWATRHESTPTVRTERTSSVILDLYRKIGRELYIEGVIPALWQELQDMPKERPDQQIEAAIDLWAFKNLLWESEWQDEEGRFAIDDPKTYFSEVWEREFAVIDPSFERMRNSGLYQGTRWQYRWAAPQFLDQMADIVGGREVLIEQLDHYFSNNLFNQTNEVGINAVFIFNRLERPDLTHRHVHRILHEDIPHRYGGNAEYPEPCVGRPYTVAPRGYLPEMDEDDGTMGAWYVLASMGIFPLIPGVPVYELVSPSFDYIELQPAGCPTLTIKTTGRKALSDPVREIYFNGDPRPSFGIHHAELQGGGTLEFIY